MSFGRYVFVKMLVSFGVFLIMCPIFFLAVGLVGKLLPENAHGVLLLFPGLPVIIGGLLATHIITERISRSRQK